jgi:hypothetical protein
VFLSSLRPPLLHLRLHRFQLRLLIRSEDLQNLCINAGSHDGLVGIDGCHISRTLTNHRFVERGARDGGFERIARRHRPFPDRLLILFMRVHDLLHTILLIARQVEPSEHHRCEPHRTARSAASKTSTRSTKSALPGSRGRILCRVALARREADACQRNCYGCGTQAEYDSFAHAAHVFLLVGRLVRSVRLQPDRDLVGRGVRF